VVGDELVPVRGDADSRVARLLVHDSPEGSSQASRIVRTLARSPIGTGCADVDRFERAAVRGMAARPGRVPRAHPLRERPIQGWIAPAADLGSPPGF
jgi:hypothetical protein